MGLKEEVKERSRRVKKRVLRTIPSGDKLTGRVVVGAVAFALVVVVVWGALHYHVAGRDFPVPSPMYVFIITKVFFVLLLLFIMCSMIWSCLESNGSKRHDD